MPYIGLILGVLIILFQGTIRQYTANLVGDWLAGSLKESTGGNYTLEYEYVRFDIFTKELRIKNLTLSLDTSVIDEDTYLQQYSNLVDISTPLVVLKLRSFWDLLVNDKLLIAYIGFQEPDIKLIRSELLSEEEKKENQEATTEKLRSYLSELAVDSFRVQNGALQVGYRNVYRQELVDFRVRNFSSVLKGFKLDEKNPQKLFHGIFVEDLQLEVLDQELVLPQLRHRLSFTRLYISTTDSLVQLDTLKINPLASADSTFKGTISLNEFSLQGIDFRKAYDEYKIDIRKILMDKPDISIVKKGGNKSGKKIAFSNAHVLFEEIMVHEIALQNARVDIDLQRRYRANKVNLSIHDYHIDTADINLGDLTKNINDFTFEAANSVIEMPDSIHQLTVGRLVMNSADSLMLLNNVQFNPIPERRIYRLYKERGVRLVNYATVNQVFLSGLDFNLALNQQQLRADSLFILSPNANITEYPYIRRKKVGENPGQLSYFIKAVSLINGNVKYNKRQNRQNNRSQAEGISVSIHNLYPAEAGEIGFDQFLLAVNKGFSEVKAMDHTIRFNGLKTRNLTSLDVTNLSFKPDSAGIHGEKINFSATNLKVRGFEERAFAKEGVLKIDKVSATAISLHADLRQKRPAGSKAGPGKTAIKKATVNKVQFSNGDISLLDADKEVSFTEVATLIDSLHVDVSAENEGMPLNFKDLTLTHGNFSFNAKSQKLNLTGKLGRFSETDSLINFANLTFKSGHNLAGSCREIVLKGFNRYALLKDKGLQFNYVYIDRPQLTIRQEKKDTPVAVKKPQGLRTNDLHHKLKAAFRFIRFDSVVSTNASLVITAPGRTTHIDNLDLLIGEYTLDSTAHADDLLRADKLNIEVKSISTLSKNDTVAIHNLSFDLIGNRLFTGNIDAKVHFKQGHLTAIIPGIFANGFSIANFLNYDFSIDTVRFAGGKFNLYSYDSARYRKEIDWDNRGLNNLIKGVFQKPDKLLFDSLLHKMREKKIAPVVKRNDSTSNFNFNKLLEKVHQRVALGPGQENDSVRQVIARDTVPARQPAAMDTTAATAHVSYGLIRHIGFNNASFNWHQNGTRHPFLSQVKFSLAIDGLLLDSLNKFNIYQHIYDLTFNVKDYRVDLKDSLNSLAFDALKLSTKNESIEVRNLSLLPKVSKYEYAHRVGRQVSWQRLQGMDVKIKQLDLFKIITANTVHVSKITASNGVLDVFKDKELPIPVNQRKPMPQDALKSLAIPIIIDSIEVKNFGINFSSRLSSANPEGKLSFRNLNAVVTNVVNIDSLIARNRYLLVSATTNIMSGKLAANFNFDMLDPTNAFIFDAHLGPMKAREFNSILSALAFVNIESGEVKDLSLEAMGDNYYATGNMRFIYNDLKVSTINKKNLKTKGMGKVIKTFFANAFVVKKNNPSFKVFPRDGAMYYERDPQKIIIDYVTKTALSGVVSSIGARNARKDIKRIQKESKKRKDEEKKAQRKANRNKSATAGQ